MVTTGIDGTKYRKCIGWKMIAGCGEGCFDTCTAVQRDACKRRQMDDRNTAQGAAPACVQL